MKEPIVKHRRSTESLVEELRGIYGDTYDLSKMVRVSSGVVTLVCDLHGPFTKSMQTHRTWGLGCKLCNRRVKYDRKIAERGAEFEGKARNTHGDKYQYTKTVYAGAAKNVVVTCPLHGDFVLNAANHLRGQGCPYCAGSATCDNDYKRRVDEVHEGRISVGPVSDMRHKIDVHCNKCGRDWRTWPKGLLEGYGCPICNRSGALSGFDMAKPANLYLIKFTLLSGLEVFKLGITNREVEKRVIGLQTRGRASHEILAIKYYEKGVYAYDDENELKTQLEGYKYMGEPFIENGCSELFTIDPRLIIKDFDFGSPDGLIP